MLYRENPRQSGKSFLSTKRYVVIDFDAVICDPSSAMQLLPDWDAYYEATLDCPPNEALVALAQAFQAMPFVSLVVVTAKPERLFERVRRYLSAIHLSPDMILLRPAMNTTPDHMLKVALVEKHVGPDWKDHVLFVLEDRDKAVVAWRAAGVLCLQTGPSPY